MAAATSRDALEVFVSRGAEILRRVGPLMPALHGASGDPEGLEMLRVGEERRVETYRAVVDVIAAKPAGLRPDVTRETATDIVVVIFSAETYQGLVSRGWSHERCASFLLRLLASQLLEDAEP
jgi:hypothetical protein